MAGVLDGLADIIVAAIKRLLEVLFSPIRTVIENHADALLRVIVATPHPDTAFGTPTNGPWPGLHTYYWETIIPLSLGLYALAIGLVMVLETTSHLFSTYHRTKLKKRAFSGLVGLLAWWWIAAFSLEFVDVLATYLLPSLSDISLFQTLSFSAMGVLGLVITMTADLLIFVLIGVVYLTRQLVLYLFVLLMPILIVLWIPGVGPFSLASGFARNLAGFYVPFLFMSIPVALLLRIGGILGQTASFSMTGIGGWIAALVIPFAALVSPIVLFSQAGQIQSVAGRFSSELSGARAAERTTGVQETAGAARDKASSLTHRVRTQLADSPFSEGSSRPSFRTDTTEAADGTSMSVADGTDHTDERRLNGQPGRMQHPMGGASTARNGADPERPIETTPNGSTHRSAGGDGDTAGGTPTDSVSANATAEESVQHSR